MMMIVSQLLSVVHGMTELPFFSATLVTIGLEQTAYFVYETDEYQVVCVKVISGDIAGRNINIDYITTSDTAQGT